MQLDIDSYTTVSHHIAVSRILLSNFRNYQELELDTDGASIVLTGENGAGKTNLLEAVSFLSPGRGLRRARLSEVDCKRINMPPALGMAWVVAADIVTANGEVHVGTGREADPPESEIRSDRRLVRIDGKTTRGQSELAKLFPVLWLTPAMDPLFQEGQSARRKFFDRLVYSFEPDHASQVAAYEYAMRERHRLLADYRPDPAWLSALEQKMAEHGVAIAAARVHTLERLLLAMQEMPGNFPKADITLFGAAENAIAESTPAVEIEARLKERLAASRNADAQAGRSNHGTHKTEIRVRHVAKDMEAELCSTGEQKALLLSIILAQAQAGKRWHGAPPVLLLDDVAAHLDDTRRRALFDTLTDLGAQAWMTGTDATLFAGMPGNTQHYHVEAGSLRLY